MDCDLIIWMTDEQLEVYKKSKTKLARQKSKNQKGNETSENKKEK